MCGIVGAFGLDDAKSFVLSSLEALKNRGKDAQQVSDGNSICSIDNCPNTNKLVGHTLHAVVSTIPQPIKGEHGVLVANCEIYNWKDLANEFNLTVKNDAEVMLHLFDKFGIESSIKLFDGVYAFAYWRRDELWIGRDSIGEKPLHVIHSTDSNHAFFAFASERKVLTQFGKHKVKELNPRKLLRYTISKNTLEEFQQPFFELEEPFTDSEEAIVKSLIPLLEKALLKRIPDQKNKVGVLFSGGIDSTLIAFLLQKHNIPFTCYSAGLIQEGMDIPDDIVWARKIAKQLNFPYVESTINLEKVPTYLEQVIPLIESSNVVKVGVALPFYLACERAKQDGVRVMFSGLGSEELFAGYQRHENSQNINLECISGLRKMYERDLYRDDVITMHHSIELRLPLLDLPLTKFALRIPGAMKIVGDVKKHILREAAKKLGLPREFADRPKKAAQYGSKFDRAIAKLAKQNGFELKSQYLNTFFEPQNQRLAVLFSGGKDSMYAMHTMQKQNYHICCLLTIESENEHSYMFHTPAISLTSLQAESLGLPLLRASTKGEKEAELADLKALIKRAVEEFDIDGIVTGALYSVYQRERVEKICEELGLQVFSPLWHIHQEKELRAIIDAGYEIILTAVAAEGLDKSWLGRVLTHEDVDKLVLLEKKLGLNVAGEGGEFESLVINGPEFSKKLQIISSTVNVDGSSARLTIIEAKLV